MKKQIRNVFLPLLGISLSALQPASADLPQITEKPWLGYFAGFQNDQFRFALSAKGDIQINILSKAGDVLPYAIIPVTWGTGSLNSGGSVVFNPIDLSTLTSEDEKNGDMKEITVTGKTSNGSTVSLHIKRGREEVVFTPKVIEPKDGVQPAIKLGVQNYYSIQEVEMKDNPKAFSKLLEKDQLKLRSTDRKSGKFDFEDKTDDVFKKFKDATFTDAESDIGKINSTYNFSAKNGASMTFDARPDQPLHRGYDFTWIADNGSGQASLTIEVEEN